MAFDKIMVDFPYNVCYNDKKRRDIIVKFRLLSSIVALSVALCLVSCSGSKKKSGSVSSSDSSVPTQSVSETVSSKEPPTGQGGDKSADDDWNPFVMQRQVLLDENCMCGVVYLGYVEAVAKDLGVDREYYHNLFKASGYANNFDFLLSMPDDHLVSTPIGQELYLIIPYDENAHVAVNYLSFDEENDFTLKVEDILYTRDNGAPFLVKCNYSDIFPDSQVVIVDSKGETLTFSPMLSLKDGRVNTSAENGKTIYDFTVYSNLADYENDEED